jgi:hypothetical protein
MTKQQLAALFSKSFERKERPNGENFYCLKDGTPDWIKDAVHEAHGDLFPNDWVYAQCKAIADSMTECAAAEWTHNTMEWADSNVDIYNSDRAAWLGSHLHFGAAVDEAVEELGHSDQGIYGDIALGQLRLLEQIAYVLIQAVEDQAEVEEEQDNFDTYTDAAAD